LHEVNVDLRDRKNAFLLVAAQCAVSVALALCGWLYSADAAISLLTGGMICTVGSAWMAFVGFRKSATRPAKEILVSFYIGEIGKFLFVMILFIVAFRKLPLLRAPDNALMFFLAFILVQMVMWFAPRLLGLNSTNKPSG
jgi:ATP synthase protein I